MFSQESVKPLYERGTYLQPSAALEHTEKEKKKKKKEDRDEQRH